MTIELSLGDQDAGQRLDRVLAQKLPDTSRSALQRWIDQGRVTIDGVVATKKTKAIANARVVVDPAPPPTTDAQPQNLPLAVLYEDEQLVVVDKAAGMVVHPSAGHPDGTLVNALLYASTPMGGKDQARPGIVHRLDKDTSGVMVVAKSEQAHRTLVEMFEAHALERRYEAIVTGAISAPLTVDTTHGRHPRDRKRFTSKGARGKRAVTHIEPIENLQMATRVRCRLETGRTHQIRVHLFDLGHPVLGDPTYRRSIADPRLRAIDQQLGRQALHAAHLGFDHPTEGRPLSFDSPVPQDMVDALDALRRLPER